jgi:ABC-type uncharacterized transport system ATPase component
MTRRHLRAWVLAIAKALEKKQRPLAVILAGHNGSGKSTLWNKHLAESLRMPLVNADRMMLSILPETSEGRRLPGWAVDIRDRNESWMQVAQKGVEAFLVDNSRGPEQAFTLCRVQMRRKVLFDLRTQGPACVPPVIATWLDRVCPVPK